MHTSVQSLGARPLATAKGASMPMIRSPVARPTRSLVVRAIAVPANYGYVMGSVALTAATMQWLAVRVALARREYKISYPAMYAEGSSPEANTFNCIQRSHQNALEYLPAVLALQTLMGLQFPVTAAALGATWAVGRVIYAQGYSTGEPAKRTPGSAIAGIVYLVLIIGCGYAGYQTILG